MAGGAFLAGFGPALAQAIQQQQQQRYREAILGMEQQQFAEKLREKQQERQAATMLFGALRGGGIDGMAPMAPAVGGGMPALNLPDVPSSGGEFSPQAAPPRARAPRDLGGGMASAMSWEQAKPLIQKYESGGRNIEQQVVPPGGGYNPSVGRVTGPSSASGPYQMIDSTWRDAARKAGIDTAQYPRAISAPVELQDKAAEVLYREQGLRPWAPYNKKLAQAVGWQGGSGGGGGADPLAGMATQTARSVAPQIPQGMFGTMDIGSMARLIEQTNPGADPAVKMMALERLQNFLAPQQKMAWEAFKTRNSQDFEREQLILREKLIGARETAQGAGWDILTDPSNSQQFRYNKRTGEARSLTGNEPYTPGGAQKLGTRADGPPDPSQVEYTAKAISEYRMPPISGWAQNKPFGQAVTARVMQLNPNYNASEYRSRYIGETRFTTGKQADTIRSFVVSIDHLDTMQEAADALANGDVQLLNRARNKIKENLGYEGPVDFNFVKNIVGAEVAKAVIGSAGGVTDREELRKGFDVANSPEQLAGVIRMAKKLMGGQLVGLRNQARNMGWSDEKFNQQVPPTALREMEGWSHRGTTAPAAPAQAPAPAAAAPRVSARPGEAARAPLPPPVGTVQNGYRFKGGDPADPDSWEPAGGR